jgi:hypothetical protein
MLQFSCGRELNQIFNICSSGFGDEQLNAPNRGSIKMTTYTSITWGQLYIPRELVIFSSI